MYLHGKCEENGKFGNLEETVKTGVWCFVVTNDAVTSKPVQTKHVPIMDVYNCQSRKNTGYPLLLYVYLIDYMVKLWLYRIKNNPLYLLLTYTDLHKSLLIICFSFSIVLQNNKSNSCYIFIDNAKHMVCTCTVDNNNNFDNSIFIRTI